MVGIDDVLVPTDSRYPDAAYRPYKDHPRVPPLIVTCKNNDDVINALRVTKEFGYKVSVKSGGHGWLNFSLYNTVVLELHTHMKGITITKNQHDKNGVAVVQAGVLLGELNKKAQENGLVAVGGWSVALGVGGLLPGGGGSLLSRRLGLAVDSVTEIDFVTWNSQKKDYELLKVSKTNKPDLFKALRGGGTTNFGVLVSFTINLYYIPPLVTLAYFNFPFKNLERVLKRYHALHDDNAPTPSFISPLLYFRRSVDLIEFQIMILYTGEPERPHIQEFNDLLKDFIDNYEGDLVELKREPHDQAIIRAGGPLGAKDASGHFQTVYMWFDSGFLDDITSIAGILIKHWPNVPRAERIEINVIGLGGAAKNNPERDFTSISFRDEKYLFSISVMTPDEHDESQLNWAKAFMSDLRGEGPGHQIILKRDRAYVNFRTPGEGEEVLKKYYGPYLDDLTAKKNEYDPDDVFGYPQGLQVKKAGGAPPHHR